MSDADKAAPAEAPKFQRRTVLIKRAIQLKFAAIVFAGVVFTALLVGADAYYTVVRIIQEENPALLPIIDQVARVDAAKMALFLIIMFMVCLFVSHRFAGPIYRFERSAQVVATGDLTHRVSLRTGDDLVELQDEMNSMISALQRLVQKDRTLAERLAGQVDAMLKRLPESADARSLERLGEDLRSLKAELGHVTRGFKA
ncbi:MAG TPA: methyl-accepting chemotaxis protein [Elusimicrobiota bacterium]|jgi:methyl-accepting chemotaxis protein|nr:methyl-accepting chemotaxis protein [Elusimicrobiota bacterium]